MTTRRKFLTTTGIFAGIGIFGKLFSQEQPKEEIRTQTGQGELWQDEVDRSKEFEGMGEHLTKSKWITRMRPEDDFFGKDQLVSEIYKITKDRNHISHLRLRLALDKLKGFSDIRVEGIMSQHGYKIEQVGQDIFYQRRTY